ncbi:MAG: helix-turn-helix domain-containing protein [Candidatus Dormibacteria bacterium]
MSSGATGRKSCPSFTQSELAHRLRISRSTLQRWEQGTATPTPRHARALAKDLGVKVGSLALDRHQVACADAMELRTEAHDAVHQGPPH